MNGNILVLGRDGQLGKALMALLGARAVAAGRQEADLLAADFTKQLDALAEAHTLSAVINAAAHTKVDKAEGDEKDAALRINAEAPGELAAWCKKRGVPLVHYSTDYVFDGSGSQPRREEDAPHPVNAYGAGKLAGERAVAQQGGEYLIFRTSWVYDAQGKNFFNTIRRLIREKEELNVVADQTGAPTYAPHLAQATLAALERACGMQAFPSGLYHLCNAGETSWHGFAQAILEHERQHNPGITCRRIRPIPSSEYPLPAPRPLNSRLDCGKAHRVFGITMPRWEDGLRECFAAL